MARNKKDKKLYVWFLMGVLCLAGIGAAFLAFLRSKQKEEPVEEITGLSLPEREPQVDESGTQVEGQEKEDQGLAGENQETAKGKDQEAGKERDQETAKQKDQETVGRKDQETGREKDQESVKGKDHETVRKKDHERKTKKSAVAAGSILYLLLVLGICIVPLLLFWLRPAENTTENRTMAALPEVWTAEGFNWNVLSEAGTYFTDHFFLRQEMVSINAGIRSEVFGISPVEDVIVGENGWLYYAATLDDYQHKNSISERALFNIAHNTALMQEYSEGLGKTFVFTIAPNKNSLYGENMPKRLRYQVAEKSDAQRLLPWLVRENVNYVDLFALFEEQEETLYYARDSHWNEKGAVLVYHTLLDACGKQHETFEEAELTRSEDYCGDLGAMLFPVGQSPEVRLQYPVEDTWHYLEGEKVEDQFIRTANEKGEGTLLMYRDSFGNSLLPYMAQTFSQTVFSRQVPYAMSDLVTYEPDILIVEKVERQLPTLGKVPPVMSAPIRETEEAFVAANSTAATVNLSKGGGYWKLEGLVDPACMDTDSRIYVEVDDGGGTKLYEAFCVSSADTKDGSTNDYGYILYVAETQMSGDTFRIRVITEQEGVMQVLLERKLYVLQDGSVEGSVKSEWEAEEAGREEAVTENSEGTDKEIDKEINRETVTESAGERHVTEEGAEDARAGSASEESQPGNDLEHGTVPEGQTSEAEETTEEDENNRNTESNQTPVKGQPNAGKRPEKSQPVPDKQAVNAQNAEEVQPEAEMQATQGQTSTGTKPAQSQTTPETQATETQKVSQPQQAAETQAQSAAQQPVQQAVTEVNRIYMEDCGSDSGYWVITYSDGHVEYVDD